MSFAERFIIPCPYLGETTIRGPIFHCIMHICSLLYMLNELHKMVRLKRISGYRGVRLQKFQGST